MLIVECVVCVVCLQDFWAISLLPERTVPRTTQNFAFLAFPPEISFFHFLSGVLKVGAFRLLCETTAEKLSKCDAKFGRDSAKTLVKMEAVHKLLKISKSEMSKHLDSSSLAWVKRPKSWSEWETQLFLLEGICTVILWQDYCGKGNLRKSCWSTVGRRFSNWACLFVHRQKRVILICVCEWF